MEILEWPAVLLVLIPALPPVLYCGCYLGFRLLGKLAVNGGGWHAESVRLGRRAVLPALAVFGLFQPLLRLESAVVGGYARIAGGKPEQNISEVVVEVVPMA